MRKVGARCCAINSPWRVSRARFCVAATRASAVIERRRQRAGAAHVDVEAGIGRGDLDVERFFRGTERFGDRPGGVERAVEAFGQNRTAVDRDHVMRARGGKPDLEHVMGAAPGVEYGAAAAFAVRVDEIGDRRIEPGLPQRLDDEIALPRAIRSVSQCCTAQPPHTPKCGQIGAMRSALGLST